MLGRWKTYKGGRRPSAAAPLFVKAYFVYSLDILFNEFIQVLSLLFLFPFAYHPRESLFHSWMIKWMNEWINQWMYFFTCLRSCSYIFSFFFFSIRFGLQGRIIKLHFGDLGLTYKFIFICIFIVIYYHHFIFFRG